MEHPASTQDGVRCGIWGAQGLQGAMILILALQESLRLPALTVLES